MTRQASETANALWTRIQAIFDDTMRTTRVETAAGMANWPGGFGGDIPDVKTVVVHSTDGWPTRDKAGSFADIFAGANANGIGPHFYIPYDGTVFRILSETRQCWHANHVNDRAIGVETGNLTHTGAPGGAGGAWPNHWVQLSTNAADVPGAKLYAKSVNNEILVALWSTNNNAQADSHPDGQVMMWFSEAQYRSWALLARWLAEVWRIPRNFSVRPHLMRGNTWQAANWPTYRQIVDADAMHDPHLRTQLEHQAPYNCDSAHFESNDPATGLPHVYSQGVQQSPAWMEGTPPTPHHKQINDLWTRLFNSYRGFHGHGYSGANIRDDHNCPGAWFDWHRFARDVWDYWWYPFDLAQASPTTPITSGRPRRDYGFTDGILRERYFDEEPSLFGRVTSSGFFPVGDETVSPHPLPGPPRGLIGVLDRMMRRYWGFWHGGTHFQLDSGSPIYALASGQLVAARLHTPDADEDHFDRNDPTTPYPTALFVLLRHELFFRRRAGSDRIDYDQEPTRVYSLYMHLGLPTGLDETNVVAANPTWLNRAIAMKKEYDLGLAFQAAHPNPAAQWNPHVTRWQRRRTAIDQALSDLSNGRVARFPEGEDAVHVSLGDFIGVAGHLDRNLFGLHLEIFSRDPIDDPWFERIDQGANATRPYHDERNLDEVTTFIRNHVTAPPHGVGASDVYRALPSEQKATRFQNIALRKKSEWALDATDFPDGTWPEARQLMWWSSVVPAMNAALTDAAAQLPADAVVWHYHPLGFLAWLNGITWRSEWPKFRVTDATGANVPVPARPPARR